MTSFRVLLVEDEDYFREVVCEHLTEAGCQVLPAKTHREAEALIRNEKFDIGILDIRLPEGDGMKLLELSKLVQPAAEIIMLTGHGTVDSAVSAMKLGSYDYLTKPCKLSKLQVTVERAYEHKRITSQNVGLKAELSRLNRYDDLIGRSAAIQKVKELIEQVAPTDSPVLVQGESGTGKELVARLIQRRSFRAAGPFVVLDCGALDESLLSSELFGHEKGAYTGAESRKPGLVEIADGGTLFVDEVADMSPSLQSRLIRVMETGEFRRLGGTEQLRVDTRIIAATSRDLLAEVQRGAFRGDLFYRLNVVRITLPPLRQRREDIPLLLESFITKLATGGRNRKPQETEVEEGFLGRLMSYDWPGNVRELRNVVERALILSADGRLRARNLPFSPSPRERKAASPGEESRAESAENESLVSLRELEKAHIRKVYLSTGGNKSLAAKVLGISVRNLYRKLDLYGLER